MSRSKIAAEKRRSASLTRVLEDAARRGLEIDVRHLPDGTRTAADAARACACDVAQIIKSIVFRVAGSDRHVLFLTAGDRRVDMARAEALAGAPLTKADAASIRAHTGFAIGGVSPLGHLTPIETFFDETLLRFDQVWAAAGTPVHVFAIAPKRLIGALAPEIAAFTSA